MTESSVAEPSVSVSQFAAVQAAEQDELPLDDVFTEQEIDDERWPHERALLLAKITSSASAFKTYQGELEVAQDQLFRPVAPLYDDVEAWLAYSAAIGAGPTATVLREHGLTLGDLARLERHWRKRFADEPAVAKRARAKAGQQAELVPLTIGQRAANAPSIPAPEPDPPSTPAAPPGMFEEVERAAILAALLAAGASDTVLRRRGVASKLQAEREVAALKQRIADDKELSTFFRQRVQHIREMIVARHAELSERASSFDDEAREAHRPAGADRPVAPVGGDGVQPPDLDATAAIDALVLDLDALPFRDDPDAVPPPLAADDLPPTTGSVDETAGIRIDMLALAPTPFEQDDDGPSNSVDETAFLDAGAVVANETPLPFSDEPALAPPPAADDLEPSDAVGETGFLDAGLLAAPELPFSGEGELDHDVRRYASYVVTLTRSPASAAQVRAQYGVEDEKAHQALTDRWQRRLQSKPDLMAEFAKAVQTYQEWLDQHEGTS